MSKLKTLLENLEQKVNRQNELLKGLEGEQVIDNDGNALTPEQIEKQFDEVETQITNLKREVEKAQKVEAAKKRNAEMRFAEVIRDEHTPEQKISKRYSFLKAIRAKAEGKALDGVEAEIQREAENEARTRGMNVEGVALPSFMTQVQKRDLTVGTAATAGNLVATDLGDITPALRPRLKTIDLGAQVLDGLVGNLDLPIGNALASAAWEGENDTTAETTPSTTLLQLRPNRLAAFTDVSKQLMVQSSVGVENWVRSELADAIARAVDAAAINGSGASNQPTGILNTAGIGDVAMGTNGLAPTYAKLIELETEIAVDNADVENMAYLTTPGIRGYLKSLALSANNAGFTWDGGQLGGYRAEVSTQVPSNLDKGTSTGVCHAILFGNWADMVIANWGIVDILVNPYTKAKEALVELVVNSYWDVGIRHEESFAAIKDALTS